MFYRSGDGEAIEVLGLELEQAERFQISDRQNELIAVRTLPLANESGPPMLGKYEVEASRPPEHYPETKYVYLPFVVE